MGEGMHLLFQIVLVLALSAVVVYLGQKLKIPSIVGFLVTGVVVGPGALGLIESPETIDLLAEIGIIMLLFTVGMEFSLRQLFHIRKTVFVGGGMQVLLTLTAGGLWAYFSGRSWNQSVFIGLLLVMSSTAIVLKLLQERAEMGTPQGRGALGVLIFQDLLVVPAMMLVPLLSGQAHHEANGPWLVVGKVVLAVPLVWLGTKYLIPHALRQIVRTRNRELFLLSILVIGFSIAGAGAALGMSLALGAFLAGLMISESEYSHQALGSILPFRDVFLSFFFISVGLLLDLNYIADHLGMILAMTVVVLVLKTVATFLAGRALRMPARTALITGLALSQVGEFSFLLSKAGLSQGLLDQGVYQTFLAIAVLTMASSPLTIGLGPRLALKFFPGKRSSGDDDEPKATVEDNHLLIVGFGMNGQNLSKAATRCGISHSIIEMNADTVRKGKSEGIPIMFGDATNEEVLAHAGVRQARMAVVAINDAVATRRIVELLHRTHPGLHILARTRFVSEVAELHRLGATEVIPEEFETSVEIFARVMKRYLISRDEIDRFIDDIRSGSYEKLRAPHPKDEESFLRLEPLLQELDTDVLRVVEGSTLAGLPLSQSRVREDYDVTILAIHRKGGLISTPGGQEHLQADDRLVVVGKRENLRTLALQLSGG